MMKYKNKKIAVLGYGIEGKSVAEFMRNEGAAVTVFDEKLNTEGIEGLEGREGLEVKIGPFPDLLDFDVVVRSPGVRPDIPALQNYLSGQPLQEVLLQKASRQEKVATTSTNIFFERCPCPVIGVTGTKGKGTTSTLIYEMLKRDKVNKRASEQASETVFLGGNIGVPPLSFLPKLTKDCIVVLELSSFQLMDCDYSPHIAVILMAVPEHQDWHTSVEEYVEAKYQIIKNQKRTDILVINTDYSLNRSILTRTIQPIGNPNEIASSKTPPPVAKAMGGTRNDVVIHSKILSVSTMPHDHPGVYVSDREIFIYQTQTKKQRILPADKLLLPGKHNWENAAAAIAAAKAAGVKTASIQHVLQTFAGLPHRLEKVGIVNGVVYYNDSFSTTPETAIAAIKAFREPKVLILGGSSKNSDFTELGKVISASDSIRGIIGIGVEWTKIKESCQLSAVSCQLVEGCKSMKEVIDAAKNMAQSGDVVLLSPACASFGMFRNYKDRGNQFREEIKGLSS